jgi:phenylacetate-CoA ligase
MSNLQTKLYNHLPASLRSLAASTYGLYLRSWRYGPETELMIAEAIERELWSRERWKTWQEERLGYMLHRAATRVPYYREQWAARRRGGDRSSWEYLENWPVLEKKTLQQNPTAFVADDCHPRNMWHEHTAGTTGTPLSVWQSRETLRSWFALFEVRARHWNGVSRDENWATLGGRPVISAHTLHPPFWVWNAPMNQLYLSANHLSKRNAPAYVAALNQYRITHMVAYSSSAAVLAKQALDLGLSTKGIKVIVTVAEPLPTWRRKIISQGFACQVKESYGMAEIAVAATECLAGTLHLWPEVGWLEIFSDTEDIPLSHGLSGRFICTSLLNTDMPLIRYSVGDRGSIASKSVLCRCGRTLPTLACIEGRTYDLLMTQDDRRVYISLNPIFENIPVSEAQIIQETLNRVRIRYVTTANFTENLERLLIDRLRARIGEVEVVLERLSEIPREANGKFRAVVCNIP